MRCLWWLEKPAGDPQWSLGVISVSAKRTPVALGKIPELQLCVCLHLFPVIRVSSREISGEKAKALGPPV